MAGACFGRLSRYRILKVTQLVYRVFCGTLNSIQCKECECAIEFYRPQNRVCGKVIFLQVCVILSTGGVVCIPLRSPGRPPGLHTPGLCTPWTTYPPELRTPQTTYPPGTTYPLGLRTPLDYVPPGLGTPHPPELRTPSPRDYVPPSVWSMCGRYASYWNAFLSLIHFNVLI